MTPTDVLGVLGFVLGIVNLGWAIWAHHEQVKEKLVAHTTVEEDLRGKALVVKLTNVGRSPMFLERVVLEGGKTWVALWLTPDPEVPEPQKTPLAVGEGRRYRLPKGYLLGAIGDVANAGRYDYWISVLSPRGEVMKVNDSAFVDCLKWFVAGVVPPPAPR